MQRSVTSSDSPSCRSRLTAASAFFHRAIFATLLLGLLQAGCVGAPDDVNVRKLAELDAAILRAVVYIESQQSEDGSWPSRTYGLFRDGVALTPHVLRSLARAEQDNNTTKHALTFVMSKVNYEFPSGSSNGGHRLAADVYGPVYFCADMVISNRPDPSAKLGLSQILLDHQIMGPTNKMFAQAYGWGYGRAPFKGMDGNAEVQNRFDHGRCMTAVAPNLSANISSTVYALDAIALQDWPEVQALPVKNRKAAALRFTARCQNFDTDDERFDDGGFFFNPADPARNKGGPAGTDKNGYARFHSSGSSTADGLRVLLRCNVPKDDPRLLAARDWLFEHFDPAHNPGTFNNDREVLRDAYYFYYAASVADTFTLLGEGPEGWGGDLARALVDKQQHDGSFVNPFTDGKEDDPIIATPFALRAMIACKIELSK